MRKPCWEKTQVFIRENQGFVGFMCISAAKVLGKIFLLLLGSTQAMWGNLSSQFGKLTNHKIEPYLDIVESKCSFNMITLPYLYI